MPVMKDSIGVDRTKDVARMLIIRITEDDLVSQEEDHADNDGLKAFLAQQGVPQAIIDKALAILPQLTTLMLCQPSEYDEWEIRERC